MIGGIEISWSAPNGLRKLSVFAAQRKFRFSLGSGFSSKTPIYSELIFCMVKELQESGGRGGVGGREGWAGGRGGDRRVSLLPPSGGPIFYFKVPLRFVAAM